MAGTEVIWFDWVSAGAITQSPCSRPTHFRPTGIHTVSWISSASSDLGQFNAYWTMVGAGNVRPDEGLVQPRPQRL